jgi:hypothetical protein
MNKAKTQLSKENLSNPLTDDDEYVSILFLLNLCKLSGELLIESKQKGISVNSLKRHSLGKKYIEHTRKEAIIERLKTDNLVKLKIENKRELLFLTEAGKAHLIKKLADSNFEFIGNVLGTRLVNTVLGLMRLNINNSINNTVSIPVINKITDYEQFKNLALQVYDRLNKEYNYGHLVPIYKIRREIGEQVSRLDFNDWLLEMQANDILQLQGGSIEDGAKDKMEDSIYTEIGGYRCYAKKLNKN